jgi:hypothetical protein
MTEEERAELHRQQLAARCQDRRARFAALAGDPAAAAAVRADWEPPILARLEAQLPPEPDCEEVCPCP